MNPQRWVEILEDDGSKIQADIGFWQPESCGNQQYYF